MLLAQQLLAQWDASWALRLYHYPGGCKHLCSNGHLDTSRWVRWWHLARKHCETVQAMIESTYVINCAHLPLFSSFRFVMHGSLVQAFDSVDRAMKFNSITDHVLGKLHVPHCIRQISYNRYLEHKNKAWLTAKDYKGILLQKGNTKSEKHEYLYHVYLEFKQIPLFWWNIKCWEILWTR